MKLLPESKKYWAPIEFIRTEICKEYSYAQSVLEIGPGYTPLDISTHFIDNKIELKNTKNIDIDIEKLDFPDQSFDFVYCRHVLEDIQNPNHIFNEMIRVAKNGYIETPSPLIECTIGVECDDYRGYIHHRYIVWTESETNTLCFLPKYPMIEKIHFNNELLYLLEVDLYWNNYYYWDINNKPNIRMYKNGCNMDIRKDYIDLLNQAIFASIKNTKQLKYLKI